MPTSTFQTFNAGGASNVTFDSGNGITFDAQSAPITMVGGAAGGDSALVVDCAADQFFVLSLPSSVDINAPEGLIIKAGVTNRLAVTDVSTVVQGPMSADVFEANSVESGAYLSGDGTAGATAGPFTVITSIRVKNGLVTTLTGT